MYCRRYPDKPAVNGQGHISAPTAVFIGISFGKFQCVMANFVLVPILIHTNYNSLYLSSLSTLSSNIASVLFSFPLSYRCVNKSLIPASTAVMAAAVLNGPI